MSNKRQNREVRQFVASLHPGFKGANDENLADWVTSPIDINDVLRFDLWKLRARSRDMAMNDDTAKRFLNLLKQNVLGHMGIRLQMRNKKKNGKPDKALNDSIETAWKSFCKKRRYRGQSASPTACGSMSMREFQWLRLWMRIIDGETFTQILRGYPHNKQRFAMRLINPDLLDTGYCATEKESRNGNRIDMGIEFDEFDRPVAYHFSKLTNSGTISKRSQDRIRIPADQIIHDFRHEYVGQIRGIPDFACVMPKQKMLHGVHEAIVIGWRVAAAKMGFFTVNDPEAGFDTGKYDEFGNMVIDAVPGSFEALPPGVDIKDFSQEYPTSTYESGHKVFMQQLANGLNISSPTLANNYEGVNYSSLRQAMLTDRDAFQCLQAEMEDNGYQPIFDEWYDWNVNVMGTVRIPESKRDIEPESEWQARGWPWVDPLKEVNAQKVAVDEKFRTRQSVIAETSGADFADTAEQLSEEEEILKMHGLATANKMDPSKPNDQESDESEEKDQDEDE
ncbi:MAG: phage portal protein [Verrucomicrobiota bacterium]